MFSKLLIANRGEIACRVAQTARRLGIRTVAVYSDADAQAAHVAACDEAVHIGGAAPRDSYLRADRILAAAQATGAQAIHPGYGFLSENEAFAEACAKAGIVFVGPPASAIAAMGSKSAAKALMEKAGVPLVPGYHGDRQEPEFLLEQARLIGFPVLIKASAGGGGKGMRIVREEREFLDALASCKREAASSFGSDQVLVERYLVKPRHIEIQVFADTQGQAVYLFERDCSVQRRHQKVIEEAPAPGMTPERRAQMGEAAVAAARAVGYVGAGTVEFIAEPDGRFYFMEMNTRLQVEHPVTEMITGQDLVEWQLRVADGEPLPVLQDNLRIHGHSIEARLYAEAPEKGFLPSIGRIRYLQLPPHVAFERGELAGIPAAVRIDGGVRQGDEISPNYDPMIAKLIVWGADRSQAIARMLNVLEQTRVVGLSTNVAFLARLMQDAAFVGADLDTGLIERQRTTLLPDPQPAPLPVVLAAALASLAPSQATQLASSQAPRQAASPASSPPRLQASGARALAASDPWAAQDSWRIGGSGLRRVALRDGEALRLVQLRVDGTQVLLALDAGELETVAAAALDAQTWSVAWNGQQYRLTVLQAADSFEVFMGAERWSLSLHDELAHAADDATEVGGRLTAPMPGKVIAVMVQEGQSVEAGQPLLVMEAMKMEHTLTAPQAGRVQTLFYGPGDQVADGAQLLAIEAQEAA